MKNLITIKASSSLLEALNLFKTHKVSTLAVVGKNFISAGGRADIFTNEGDQVIGLISSLDLSRIILENPGNIEKISVLHAIGESLESQSLWILPPDNILSLLELFSKGIHSVFLKDDGNLEIFTRMDLVNLILSKYSSLLQVKVEELYTKDLKKVSSQENLLKILMEMSKNQIFALPIIENNKLVGTISLSDFKEIILEGKVEELSLNFFKKPELVSRGSCLKTDSLETALLKIKNGHIHRLWILEGEEAIGVLSISDICRFVHEKIQSAL